MSETMNRHFLHLHSSEVISFLFSLPFRCSVHIWGLKKISCLVLTVLKINGTIWAKQWLYNALIFESNKDWMELQSQKNI